MPYDPKAAAAASAAASRNRLQSLNDTPEDRAETANRQATAQIYGPNYTEAQYLAQRTGYIDYLAQKQRATAAPKPAPKPVKKTTTSSTVRRASGGGGGGGGGGGTPMMNQSMVDWIANVLRSGKPAGQTYSPVDLPDAPAFNPGQYDQALSAWNQAGLNDQGVINKSGQDMLNFLNTNYRNAYADPSVGTGGTPLGMDPAALQRVLQMQGVNPQGNDALAQLGSEAARAASMAGNWRQAMSANEEQAQRNRIANAMSSTSQSTNALNAALGAGRLQIGQARTQAEAAAQQQAWQAAVAEMQFNAQRQDAINAANASSSDSYRNAVLQQLMALAQANVGNAGVTLPDMAALGLAPLPGGGSDPADPLNWKGIAAGIADGSIKV